MNNLLPKGWTSSQLSELGSVKTSSVDKKSVDGEPSVKLLNYMDVYKNNFITSKINLQNVTAKPCQVEASSLKVGDVLFTPSSETPDDIGHSAVVMEEVDKMVYSYHLMRFRDESDKLDNSFKGYAFKTNEIYKQFYKQATGSTRFTLSVGEIEKTVVMYPENKKEQKKIAEILSSVDEVIELTEKEISKLQDLKKAMMQELLAKGIGHTKFKDSPVGKIPEIWNLVNLEKISDIVTSGPRGWAKYYSDEGEIYLRIANLTREHINLRFRSIQYVSPPDKGEAERARVKEGDILISITADLGIIGVVPRLHLPAYINQHISLVRLKDGYNSRFIGHFLASFNGRRQFFGAGDVGAKSGLNLSSIRGVNIPLPPTDEQVRIVDSLDSIDILISKKLEKLESLKNSKNGLMQDLLTGKVRVKV